MAKAATATKPRSKPAPKADAKDDKAIEAMREAVKGLIAIGKERGFITEEELDNALPPDQISSEQREDILVRFAEMKINITEGDDADDDGDGGDDSGDDGESAETSTEVSPRAGNVADDDVGRTDDPVRMYLREMGSVELLSREGEIAIAKRIEAGREKMISGDLREPADHHGAHRQLAPGADRGPPSCCATLSISTRTYGGGLLDDEAIAKEESERGRQRGRGRDPLKAQDGDDEKGSGEEGERRRRRKARASDGEGGDGEGEGDEDDRVQNMSLAAMEEALMPQVLDNAGPDRQDPQEA